MASLYEITGQYAELFDRLSEAQTDFEVEVICRQIEAVEVDIADKAEAYAKIMLNLKSDAEAYKEEKMRLAIKQTLAESAVERLKNNIMRAMEITDSKEIRTKIGKWCIQKNPPKVVVNDVDAVPKEWFVPQPSKVDLSGMLKYIKETGEAIPGAQMVQEYGLRFR